MNWIRENIERTPSFNYYLDHVELIDNTVISNPTLCAETCKSLIEGICKTILTNKNTEYDTNIPFQGLVHLTLSRIINPDEVFKNDLTELGRRIAGVSQQLGQIRNNTGFVSHGMDILNPKLTETVSIFYYKITDTIGGFILKCYTDNKTFSKEARIHYEDCKTFNDKFDDIYPLTIGDIELSASKALYMEDYEAYKESYYEFLEELKNNELM